MSFISRVGNQLRLDGKRYRFLGVNNYPLLHNSYTANQLDTFFTYCVRDKISVVRFWCFDKTPYNGGGSGNIAGNFQYIVGNTMFFREATFAQLDLVLDRAKAAGIKLSLVFSNGADTANDEGIKQNYCRWNNAINGTSYDTHDSGDKFHTDINIRTRFKLFMEQITGRVNTINGRTYASDDTIFAFELMNEGRYTNDGGTETGANTAASSLIVAMKNWYIEMATYLKATLGVSQLVSTGSAAQYYDFIRGDSFHNGSGLGLDFNLDHGDSHIDYADFHSYPYDDTTGQMRSYGTASIASITNALTLAASGTAIIATLASHGFSAGQIVEIFDVTQSNYSGFATILATPDANTFTYTASNAPSSPTASGFVRTITLAGFTAMLLERLTVAHTTLSKPLILGEYGVRKDNIKTTNPLNSYPKDDNHKRFFDLIFNQLDIDGVFLWHYTHLFDDANYNIKPDGVHSGGNANSNLNDDDTNLLLEIRKLGKALYTKRINSGTRTVATRSASGTRSNSGTRVIT